MKLDPKLLSLKAIKPHKYGTRHLTAGEEYEAPPRQAVALVAARKAAFAERKPQAAAAPKAPLDIDSLRREAERLGIVVDGRWGAFRLRSEIAQAQRG